MCILTLFRSQIGSSEHPHHQYLRTAREEDGRNNSGRAAATATAAMETRDVPIQAGVAQTASLETACGAEGAEPLMEVPASKEKNTEYLPEAQVALAEEVETDQTSSTEAVDASANASASCSCEAEDSTEGSGHSAPHAVSTLAVWPTSVGSEKSSVAVPVGAATAASPGFFRLSSSRSLYLVLKH